MICTLPPLPQFNVIEALTLSQYNQEHKMPASLLPITTSPGAEVDMLGLPYPEPLKYIL